MDSAFIVVVHIRPPIRVPTFACSSGVSAALCLPMSWQMTAAPSFPLPINLYPAPNQNVAPQPEDADDDTADLDDDDMDEEIEELVLDA